MLLAVVALPYLDVPEVLALEQYKAWGLVREDAATTTT
jgi:hypothetical protein